MKSRQTNSETKYTRRPILPEIEFVNLPLVEFHSSISAGAWGISCVPSGCSVPWGCSLPWGKIFCYLSTPQYWTPPTVLMISPRYSNFKAWYPPRYWTLFTVLMISPTCIMISPTVLNILHDTQDNPHGTHDITPWYWTPPRYSRYPPTVLNTPTVLKISPTVLMISSHGTEHPHGTEHHPRYCTHIIQGGSAGGPQPEQG